MSRPRDVFTLSFTFFYWNGHPLRECGIIITRDIDFLVPIEDCISRIAARAALGIGMPTPLIEFPIPIWGVWYRRFPSLLMDDLITKKVEIFAGKGWPSSRDFPQKHSQTVDFRAFSVDSVLEVLWCHVGNDTAYFVGCVSLADVGRQSQIADVRVRSSIYENVSTMKITMQD